MYKKMLTATIIVATLLIFVSCQEKKEGKKNNSNKTSEKMMNQKPTFRNLENKCPSCPESKCDSCPKDKCCTNDEQSATLPKEENIISQEVKPEANLPLEEFKASLENLNPTSDNIAVEKNEVEVH